MTGPVFVDTNVFLYARDPSEPSKQQRALEWLAYLWRENLGRTSAQVLSEYYVNLTRKLSTRIAPEQAWEEVRLLFAWHPQPVDEAVMHGAREIEQRYRLGWWDSMVVGAARLQGCALLLTEDLQDGAELGGVTVRNPFTLAVEEGRALYRAAPAVQRHRPRGRPRGRPRKSR